MNKYLYINHYEENSSIYSIKGNSFVIWFQGCTLNCKGCWNKYLHKKDYSKKIEIDYIIKKIIYSKKKYNIENVTLLGGEPLQQNINNLINLLKKIKKLDLSIILYTGYENEELKKIKKINKIYKKIDILIKGRYKEELRNIKNHLIGSSNQEIIFLSNKYKKENIKNGTYIEINIDLENINIYGYPDILL